MRTKEVIMRKVLLWSVALLLIGCKPKFDSNTEWKAIDVIYTVLDPDAEEQFILINKAFQNSEDYDARDIAMVNDSIYHGDSIHITIDNLDDNLEPIYLKRTFHEREEGIFSNENNLIYTFNTSELPINMEERYRVELTNLRTDKKSYAVIKTLGDISIIQPRGEIANLNFIFIDPNPLPGESVFAFKNDEIQFVNYVDKRIMYNSNLYLVYKTEKLRGEIESIDTLIYPIDRGLWHDGNVGRQEDNEKVSIKGEDFIDFIADNISDIDLSLRRREFMAESSFIEVVGYAEEMMDYTKAEANFSSLSQTKPFYTNVFDVQRDEPQAGLVTSKRRVVKNVSLGYWTMEYLRTKYPNLGF